MDEQQPQQLPGVGSSLKQISWGGVFAGASLAFSLAVAGGSAYMDLRDYDGALRADIRSLEQRIDAGDRWIDQIIENERNVSTCLQCCARALDDFPGQSQ